MSLLLSRFRAPLEWLRLFKVTARERYDLITPLAILALGSIGVAFIYSAQYYTRPALPKELGLSWILAVVSQYWVK